MKNEEADRELLEFMEEELAVTLRELADAKKGVKTAQRYVDRMKEEVKRKRGAFRSARRLHRANR